MEEKKHLIKVNTRPLEDTDGYNLCPSQIIPSVEYIKNTERSLGGKLHIDISCSKQSLQIVYEMLKEEDFAEVMKIFDSKKCDPDLEILAIEYFDFHKNKDEYNEEVKPREFFVDGITFNPLVTESGIKWRDVTISLLEV